MSDLVGENLATKGDELYFQDLPIYNKLISLEQRWGKNRHPLRQERETNSLQGGGTPHMKGVGMLVGNFEFNP